MSFALSDDSSAEEEEKEEDATAWRAGQEDEDDGGAVDDRVALAFESLNTAIGKNNEIEAAHTEAVRKLEEQKVVGQQHLQILEKNHARQLRKLEKFRQEQEAANEVATTLRGLTRDLSTVRTRFECAVEALELQRNSATDELRQDAGWREVEAEMESRRKKAEVEMNQLKEERRRCAVEMERRAKKVVERSAAIADVAQDAMPFLAKQASVAFRVKNAEAAVQERGEETAKAKADVKKAMNDLETISLDIAAAEAKAKEDAADLQRQKRASSEGKIYLY